MSKRHLLMWLLMLFLLAAPFVAADTIDGLTGFSDTAVGAALITHRVWNDTIKNFTARFNTSVNVGGTIGHMLGRGNRLRNEFVYGTQDTGGDINFQVFNGTGWGNLLEVTSNLTNGNSRAFDIAVLNQSGLVLLVYENTSAPDNKIMFRLWNGTTYSAETAIDGLSAGGEVKFIRAVPKPNSNSVMIVTLDAGSDVFAVLWNGTTNTTVNATKINLTATAITATSMTIDFAWETQSQDGLVVYGIADGTQYRNFTNNAWSVEGQFFNWQPSAANGDDPLYNQLCSDPTSNFIAWIGKDNDDDVNVAIWNGTAVEPTPTPPTEEATTEPTTLTTSGISCAWETNSGRALFAFIDSNVDDEVEFVIYNKTGWSNTTLESPARTGTISAATGANENLRLIPNPVTNEIMMEVGRSVENVLYMIRWNGSTDWIQPTNKSMGTVCNQAADPTPCFSYDWGKSVAAAALAATAPPNLTVEIGDDAQIIWNLTGSGGSYFVERNGTLFDGPRAWTAGQEIIVVPNTFFLGLWNYTLFFNQSDGTPGTPSTSFVRVVDTIFPNCSQLTGFGSTTLIKKTITIDGNTNDWAAILDNAVQVRTDPTLEQGDPDQPGTADRDMTKFAYTQNQSHLFFYFERLAKGT
ncbi:hypothetical protein HY490_03865, partial [Candidatus Woesearchaeota archaeon]|nr:hypothetical protein [Candidatus Woesearchaeota archaeon]